MSPPSIRAETAAEKYRAVTRRSSTQMGIESRLEWFSRLQPSIRACQKLKRIRREGRAVGGRGWQVEKGVRTSLTAGRFWIKTTPRRRARERKREIFHGFLYCRCCRALHSFAGHFYFTFDPVYCSTSH